MIGRLVCSLNCSCVLLKFVGVGDVCVIGFQEGQLMKFLVRSTRVMAEPGHTGPNRAERSITVPSGFRRVHDESKKGSKRVQTGAQAGPRLDRLGTVRNRFGIRFGIPGNLCPSLSEW